MGITRKKLSCAVEEEIITEDQAEKLYTFLQSMPSTSPRFDFTHVLYYMGGLIAIGAMTLFMNLGWENFGGWGILAISVAYGVAGIAFANSFRNKDQHIPAGICTAFVVALIPLAIYGLQQAMGWWPEGSTYRDYHQYIKWHWIFLELGTLAVGAIIAFIYRYPFLQMPVAVTLWYMSMDLAVMLAGGERPDFELRSLVSLYFGLTMTLFAFWVDIRSSKSGDYAFWLYIFGVIAFWGGLTSQHSDSELSKFFYLCINLVLIVAGVIIVRRVFVVFGAIGCSVYLGHLAAEVFKKSWLFPIALTAIGLGVIFLGLLWQKNEKKITRKVRNHMPQPLQELMDKRVL